MKIKLRNVVRVAELADTTDRLIKKYQQATEVAQDTFLKALYQRIERQYNQIVEAIKRGVAYSELEDADTLRDEKIRALDKVLNGYRNLPLDEIKAHAEKLYTVFSKYGVKITQENYVNESGLIESLLKDLTSVDLQASITALSGVRECIEQIKQAQENFNQKRLKYENSQVAKSSQESASSMKKPLLQLINNELLQYLSTMKMVNPTQYTAFADAIAETINTTNEVVKKRGKSIAEKKENTAQ